MAILFLIFALEYEGNPFWNLISSTLSMVLWLILALGGMELERPYTMYNATSGNIESGYIIYTSPISPYLAYLFLGMAVIMFLYLMVMTWDKYINFKPR